MISCFNRVSISHEVQPVSSDVSHVNQQKKFPKCKFCGYKHVFVNSGKAPGLDGIPVELLKVGSRNITEAIKSFIIKSLNI